MKHTHTLHTANGTEQTPVGADETGKLTLLDAVYSMPDGGAAIQAAISNGRTSGNGWLLSVNPQSQAYRAGWRNAQGIAISKMPKVGEEVETEWGRVVATKENVRELCFVLSMESEMRTRIFESNCDAEWAAYEAGVSDAIDSDILFSTHS